MTTNQQLPEPLLRDQEGTLDLHSVFSTIQGEGPYSGHRAVFVRLAGCNLACPGCDTLYTTGRQMVGVWEVVDRVNSTLGRQPTNEYLVVITGGEPLRQEIGPLVCALLGWHYRVQIESNGMFAPDQQLYRALLTEPQERLCLVVSPKTKKINVQCHAAAHAFKYVLDHRSVDPLDGLPVYALEHSAGGGVARPRSGAPVYLTPYDDPDDPFGIKRSSNLGAVAASCERYGYVAGVQLHKLIGME